MKQWFNCKVRYHKQDDEGKISRVTESYLIDATNFTEAETRCHEQMEQIIDGTFEVVNVSKTNIHEIINFEGFEEWYKTKIQYVSVDDESGKAKATTNYILNTAESVKDAFEKVEHVVNGYLVPVTITKVELTKIIDVFPYISGE
jgi:hypothetical protein